MGEECRRNAGRGEKGNEMIYDLIIGGLTLIVLFAVAMYACESGNDKLWCLAEAVADLGELKAEAHARLRHTATA